MRKAMILIHGGLLRKVSSSSSMSVQSVLAKVCMQDNIGGIFPGLYERVLASLNAAVFGCITWSILQLSRSIVERAGRSRILSTLIKVSHFAVSVSWFLVGCWVSGIYIKVQRIGLCHSF
jgi:hypothetical protein